MFTIEDFLLAAEAALEINAERLVRVTNIPLAASALAAPFASFGGHDFYERPVQRAAILAFRMMRNQPLPDGNTRVALILMDDYLDRHGLRLAATQDDRNRTFRAVADRQMTEDYFVVWLDARTEPLNRAHRAMAFGAGPDAPHPPALPGDSPARMRPTPQSTVRSAADPSSAPGGVVS